MKCVCVGQLNTIYTKAYLYDIIMSINIVIIAVIINLHAFPV